MTKSIHVSDIRLFRTCRRKWRYQSPLKLNLEDNAPIQALHDGTLFHTMFELVHRDGMMPSKELFWQVFEKLNSELDKDDIADLQISSLSLSKIVAAYFEFWRSKREKWSNDKFEFYQLERQFDIDPPKELYQNLKTLGLKEKFTFGGRIDGIVKRKDDGTYWLWENKTSARPENLIKSLWNDNQTGLYLWAAQEIFSVPIKGVIYNIVKKTLPKTPEKLKDGTLSKNKAINTTAAFYFKCALENHPELTSDEVKEKYRDILTILATTEQDFYQRVEVIRTRTEITSQLWSLGYTALEMLNELTPLYPTESISSCQYCSFRSPCLARNKGENEDSILQTNFKKKRGYQPLEISE